MAIVVTLGRMYRDSEMAIWFSSGVALTRFIAPVLRMCWPVLLVVAVLVLLVWPWGNRSSAELRERYEQRSDLSRVTPGVFQTSRDGSRVFFIEKSSDEAVNAQGRVRAGQRRARRVADVGARRTRGNDRQRPFPGARQRAAQRSSDRQSGERTLASFARYQILAGEQQVQRASNRSPKTCPRST